MTPRWYGDGIKHIPLITSFLLILPRDFYRPTARDAVLWGAKGGIGVEKGSAKTGGAPC